MGQDLLTTQTAFGGFRGNIDANGCPPTVNDTDVGASYFRDMLLTRDHKDTI